MLSHVTFTGWDRHTDPAELAAFCNDYPQERIEIAVLYSANQDDADRYPQASQAAEILRVAKASGQRSAVHVCGRAARQMLGSARVSDGSAMVDVPAAALISLADRVQINVPEDWAFSSQSNRFAFIASQALGRPVILQSRDVAGWPDVEHFGPGVSRMVPFLFDRSAGTGVEMTGWPDPPPGRLVGYAGGIGPDNAAELLSRLYEHPGARVWIDMESRIRERDSSVEASRVSVVKCSRVMNSVMCYFGAP
jgi:hypothetical protein